MSSNFFVKKTFWIINQYASTPETGIGGRHYYLAKELAEQGHNVYVIAASYTHLLHKPPKMHEEFRVDNVAGFKFVWISMPNYRDAHDKRRILNWFKFTWKLRKLPKIITEKPHAILASSPAPFLFFGAQYLAENLHAKLAFEVRDIWPLTLIELGGYSPKHPFILFMQWVEDKAYRDSDVVLSNLPHAVDHMLKRGMPLHKFTWIPNGFDEAEWRNCPKNEISSEIDLVFFDARSKGKFVAIYTGSHGSANSLDNFLDAAKILINEDIIFLLVGDGREKKRLLQRVKEESLNNTFLFPVIEKSKIPSLLNKADVAYLGAPSSSIYKFGVSPNKMFDYMMAKLPIVYAIDSGNDPVGDAGCGIKVPSENSAELAKAILACKSMAHEDLTKMGENGRLFAIHNHSYKQLAQKVFEVLK